MGYVAKRQQNQRRLQQKLVFNYARETPVPRDVLQLAPI